MFWSERPSHSAIADIKEVLNENVAKIVLGIYVSTIITW